MRFDWYSATIVDTPAAVIAGLREDLGESVEVVQVRPLLGYDATAELVGARGVCAKVMYGGGNGYPHAEASGECTEPFVRAVRSRWNAGRHYVTRFDAAEDFTEPGCFERLKRMALLYADRHRLDVHHVGDFHRELKGRTVYLGSTKSAVRVRLYEKGKQLLSKGMTAGVDVSLDWSRLEAQVRPQRDARLVAASSSAGEAWGFSGWTQGLVREVLELEVPRVVMHPGRESDDERALRFMCQQYSGVLRRLQVDLGDWPCVGLEVGRLVDEAGKRRRRG